MPIERPQRLRGPQSAQLRAALYYARKRRLARLSAPSDGGGGGPASYPDYDWTSLVHANGGTLTGAASSGGSEVITPDNTILLTDTDSWIRMAGTDDTTANDTPYGIEIRFKLSAGLVNQVFDIIGNLSPDGYVGFDDSYGFRLRMASESLLLSRHYGVFNNKSIVGLSADTWYVLNMTRDATNRYIATINGVNEYEDVLNVDLRENRDGFFLGQGVSTDGLEIDYAGIYNLEV